jgi:hypothetical protein
MPKEQGVVRSLLVLVSAAIYSLCGVAAVPLVWMLVIHLFDGQREPAAIYGLALIGLMVLILAWFALSAMLNLLIGHMSEVARQRHTLENLSSQQAKLLTDVVERLDGLAHWAAMSEATRSVLVRQREIEVFTIQIQQAIGQGQWDEADRLVQMFRSHFGDVSHADQLSKELTTARDMAGDRVIRGRINEIRRLMDELNFQAAELAIDRLAEEHPSDKRAEDLRVTLARAQRRHHETVEETFRQHLADFEFNKAAQLIEEMTWLEPDAAAALRQLWKDSVRQGQIEARTAFTNAVKERRWAVALDQAEKILARYPETTLASEVGKLIDKLHERADGESSEPAGTVELESPPE